MFDIDGTLVESYDFDSTCFQAAVKDVLGVQPDDDWGSYRHVTDSGILEEIFDREEVVAGRRPELMQAVKSRFISRIAQHLDSHSCHALPGAAEFMAALNQRSDIVVALATGGWRESALMKMQAAGLHLDGIAMATASDHYDRMAIMKLAEKRAAAGHSGEKVYFGDGPWDHRAATALAYHFVLVGERFQYAPAISHYREAAAILENIMSVSIDR